MTRDFTFQHFGHKAWSMRMRDRGLRVFVFDERRLHWNDDMSASEFISLCREMVYTDPNLSDNICVAAKLIASNGSCAVLKVDRDFFEICSITEDKGSMSGFVWQLSGLLDGFKVYELWFNMLKLIQAAEKRTAPVMPGTVPRKTARIVSLDDDLCEDVLDGEGSV